MADTVLICEISSTRQRMSIKGFRLEDTVDERATCEFYVVNSDYDLSFTKGEPVEIYSSDLTSETDWEAGKLETLTYETDEYYIQPDYVLTMNVNKGEMLFAGVIEEAEGTTWTPDGPLFYRIEAIDYHYCADKRIATKVYTNEYVRDIVVDLWETYLKEEDIDCGTEVTVTFTNATNKVNATAHGLENGDMIRFYTTGALPDELSTGQWYYVVNKTTDDFQVAETSGGSAVAFTDDGTGTNSIRHDFNIDEGDELEEAIFNYVPVSQALNSLAEQSQMWWKIDANSRLFFVERGTFTAPWTITKDDVLRGSFSCKSSASLYRNRQIIRGPVDETSEQVEIRKGDGQNQAFTMSYPLARVPTVEVSYSGGAYSEETVGIQGVDTGKDWYWSKGDKVVAQDSEGTALDTDDLIKVTYTGQYPIVVISNSYDDISDRQTVEGKGTGIVEHVKKEPQNTTREAVIQIADNLIERYKTIGSSISFRTLRHGLRAGHLATISITEAGLDSVEMLIDSIEITNSGNTLIYSIHGVEGPEVGSWTKLFADIAREADNVVREGLSDDEVVIQLFNYKKDWTESENPNIFTEVYPANDLFPANDLYPMFETDERISYLEWVVDGSPAGRKAVTSQTGAATSEIETITYIDRSEANGELQELHWYGGTEATASVGTGVKVAEEDNTWLPLDKTDSEAFQVTRTDRKWS